MKVMKSVNLNKGDLYINRLHYGLSENIEIRVGHYKYVIDVTRSSHSAFVEIYNKLDSDRKSYSKYCAKANLAHVVVNSNAVLTREFFENFHTIAAAQRICKKYCNALNMEGVM